MSIDLGIGVIVNANDVGHSGPVALQGAQRFLLKCFRPLVIDDGKRLLKVRVDAFDAVRATKRTSKRAFSQKADPSQWSLPHLKFEKLPLVSDHAQDVLVDIIELRIFVNHVDNPISIRRDDDI